MQRKISAEEKAKVALVAIQGNLTQAEISSKFGVHTTQINRWKKQAMGGFVDIFSNGKERRDHDHEREKEELYTEIGKLRVENEWLKKKSRIFEL
jgi:transposase-like protein